jgi:hypothetical protein
MGEVDDSIAFSRLRTVWDEMKADIQGPPETTWTVINMTYYNPSDPIEHSILLLLNGTYYILVESPYVSQYTVTGKTPQGVLVEVPLSNVHAIERYTGNQAGVFSNRISHLDNKSAPKPPIETR